MEKIIKCCQCGKELLGGFYNTPYGIYCSICWKKESKKTRDRALKEVLDGFANIGQKIIK